MFLGGGYTELTLSQFIYCIALEPTITCASFICLCDSKHAVINAFSPWTKSNDDCLEKLKWGVTMAIQD